jgi:hypothetical protein
MKETASLGGGLLHHQVAALPSETFPRIRCARYNRVTGRRPRTLQGQLAVDDGAWVRRYPDVRAMRSMPSTDQERDEGR